MRKIVFQKKTSTKLLIVVELLELFSRNFELFFWICQKGIDNTIIKQNYKLFFNLQVFFKKNTGYLV